MDAVETPWRRAWAPVDRRQIYEWARALDLEGDYSQKGPFKISRSPYLMFPFQLLLDDQVRMINLLKAPQSGGSLIGDIFFHWVRRNKPSPFMWTFQSDDDAGEHWSTRISPTIEANPELCGSLDDIRQKRTLFQFPGFNAFIQGANPNSLQRKTIRYEVNDEVWKWKPGMLEEAWARTGSKAFRNICKILNISQAGIAGDQWDLACNNGRRHDLAVRCFSCRTLVPYQFFDKRRDAAGQPVDDPRAYAGIVWNENARLASGAWDIPRAAGSVRFRCRHCGHDHPFEPHVLARFNSSGDYLCLDPDRSRKNITLRWTALVNGGWDDLLIEYLRALESRDQGVLQPLIQFMQKKESVPWDDSQAEEKVTLTTGDYLMGEPWSEAQFTFLTADYQEGRANDSEHYWISVRSWRRGGASRLRWFGKVRQIEEIDTLQAKFKLKPAAVCIDGGDKLLEIAAACASRGWTVLVGDDPETFPHRSKVPGARPILRAYSPRRKVDPHRGTKLARRRFAYLFYWSNPSVKSILWKLRHGRGAKWDLPADLSAEYRLGIDSEVKVRLINRRTGVVTYIWKNVAPNRFNHPWDCECMQVVCALIAGLLTFDVNENTAPDVTATRDAAAPVAPHDQPEQLTLAGVEQRLEKNAAK